MMFRYVSFPCSSKSSKISSFSEPPGGKTNPSPFQKEFATVWKQDWNLPLNCLDLKKGKN